MPNNTSKINIFWFRRDLRLNDNTALYKALSDKLPVLCLFIFDTTILDKLPANDKRVSFIYKNLKKINADLEKQGSGLIVKSGKPEEIWKALLEEYTIQSVYTNHDYEPNAIVRDEKISQLLKANEVNFQTYKDQVIFEKLEITKDDNTPYTVFTPYYKKWLNKLEEKNYKTIPSGDCLDQLLKISPSSLLKLEDIGFEMQEVNPEIPSYLEKLDDYGDKRDFPALDATSHLGMHLRFGTISIRKLVNDAIKSKGQIFLSELVWREFYMMILWNFPYSAKSSFKKQYDNIVWRNNEEEFSAWCKGETGYPIVDAGMRQLNTTGWMHNRVRMVVASFLTKHLLIDWRWGETYFAAKLLDYELASNVGGWQWAAGCGNDAAPYFRVFNPELQTKKFDKDFVYIKKWVPEFGTKKYAQPIVEHTFARERVLKVYKEALTNL